MNTVLIKNTILPDGTSGDVFIENGRFVKISPKVELAAQKIIDGSGKAILPPFYNTHCHAAMSLLRGYADDMELFTWLSRYIWPLEAKLTEESVYHGSRLAILEMIKTGSVFFNDMYWFQRSTIRAAKEMGVRAAIGTLYLEEEPGKISEEKRLINQELLENRNSYSSRIQITLAPHAIYTVSEKKLRELAELSREYSLPLHIHLAETMREVEDCMKNHGGLTPVEYLDSLGLLNNRLIAAHCVAFSESDFAKFGDSGAVIAHMPCSNLKLNSGCFNEGLAAKHGCRVTLGTDGCASNNNLSMIDEAKFAALIAKMSSNSPSAGTASTIFKYATQNGANAFGIDAGVIEEGKIADAILVDLKNTMLCGGNLISDMVYGADSSCIDTVICDGNVLMENRIVENEEEIVVEATACRRRLTGK